MIGRTVQLVKPLWQRFCNVDLVVITEWEYDARYLWVPCPKQTGAIR